MTGFAEPSPATRIAPITRDNLRRMVHACDPDTLAGCRDRLLLVMGWRYALHRGQLAALAIEHVRFGRGMGEVEDLYRDWMLALAIAVGEPVLSGPVFRRVTKHDTLWSPMAGLSGDGTATQSNAQYTGRGWRSRGGIRRSPYGSVGGPGYDSRRVCASLGGVGDGAIRNRLPAGPET